MCMELNTFVKVCTFTLIFRVFTIILIRIVNRCFLFFCGFHWIHYKGRPADAKDAPIIIAAPHSSMFDVFAVGLYDIPTFVAREDMRNVFLFGREYKLLYHHFPTQYTNNLLPVTLLVY